VSGRRATVGVGEAGHGRCRGGGPRSAGRVQSVGEHDRVEQVVPRPDGWLAGRPAPWADVPLVVRAGITVARVRRALCAWEPTDSVAVGARGIREAGGAGGARGVGDAGGVAAPRAGVPTAAQRPAAVLVAVFDEEGEARVLLTRRSGALRSHRGQVSFPGGGVEPGEDVEAAARREAAEEVGLDPATVTVMGRLSPMVTATSWRWMVPVVAELPGRPRVRANPGEVARVFDVALADLVADGVFHEELWPVRFSATGWGPRADGPGAGAAEADARAMGTRPEASGSDASLGEPDVRRYAGEVGGDGVSLHPVWFFDVAGETVWGATARVLVELLTMVLGVVPPPAGPIG
jgi:8-oxo-dGTP pyrophosphatase MutT (NUDIX family)